MKFLHDIIRERLLFQAGIFPKPKKNIDYNEIRRKQWSIKFEELMRNRLCMGYFRYGELSMQKGKCPTDNVVEIERRLKEYRRTRNAENLVDIANFAMVEFVVKEPKLVAHDR